MISRSTQNTWYAVLEDILPDSSFRANARTSAGVSSTRVVLPSSRTTCLSRCPYVSRLVASSGAPAMATGP